MDWKKRRSRTGSGATIWNRLGRRQVCLRSGADDRAKSAARRASQALLLAADRAAGPGTPKAAVTGLGGRRAEEQERKSMAAQETNPDTGAGNIENRGKKGYDDYYKQAAKDNKPEEAAEVWAVRMTERNGGSISEKLWYNYAKNGYKVTNVFGGNAGNFGGGHLGTDFVSSPGANAVTAFNGTVVKAGPSGGNGFAVTVEHTIDGCTYYTTYAHLSPNSIKVGVGDKVSSGDAVGAIGNSGNSGGVHLHVALYQVDGPVTYSPPGYVTDSHLVGEPVYGRGYVRVTDRWGRKITLYDYEAVVKNEISLH